MAPATSGAMLGPVRFAAASPARTGGVPEDHTREAPALAVLEAAGFTAQFIADGDRLRVRGSRRQYGAGEVLIQDYYRFEGTSNPDDMSIIYVLEASDGTRGVLVDAFGSYASPAVGALVDRMRLDPPARPARAA